MGRYKFKLIIILFWAILSSHFNTCLFSQKTGDNSDKSLVRIWAGYDDNINSFDPLVIYYEENATYGFDGQYDAYKLFNTDAAVTNFYVFGSDGTKQSICGIPFCGGSECKLGLGLKTDREGIVIIKVTDITFLYSNLGIILTDLTTNKSVNLSTDNYYKVFLPAGHYQERFILTLSGTISYTDYTENSADPLLSVFSSCGVLRTDINLPASGCGWLKISDISGRTLFQRKVVGPGSHEFIPMTRDGIYIVTLVTGTRMFARKVVVRR